MESQVLESPGMLVGGRWIRRPSSGAGIRQVEDPAHARHIATVPEAAPAEVDSAVAAAREAFDSGEWAGLPPARRGDALLELARRVRESREELALLESLNVGKPIQAARGDVDGAVEVLDYYGRVVVDLPGEVTRSDQEQVTIVTREPVGVVACIVPWNYPLVLAAQSIAPALAAGCSVVLKPAELTPLTAIKLAELAVDLFPPGVLNLVLGDGQTVGEQLVRHPGVDSVLFTGSTEVGSRILQHSAQNMKRVTLELGGKSPTVILPGAPFEASVVSALQKIVTNQGENCAAGSRLLVHSSIAPRFLAALAEAANELRIGDPQHDATDLGPLISAQHKDRVLNYVKIAEDEGRRLYRGSIPDAADLPGHYVPLSMYECGPGSRLWREEVFGPVLAVTTFDDDDEAVELANDSPYGLMAVIWCGDRAHGMRVGQRIRAGVIRINNGLEPFAAPWGGFRMSGIGRTSGRYGLDAVTELKQMNVGLAPLAAAL